MTFRHRETNAELEYEYDSSTGLSICPHGNQVAYSDECDQCMEEYRA